jgi:hypothetical protein
MKIRLAVPCAGALVALFALASAPAQALTLQECSTKFKAAKAAGTAKGMKWNDFRKAECGADAAAAPAAATTPASPPASTAAKPGTVTSPVAATPGAAVYPTAIAPKYSKEPEGKARMHTCLDQYNANKTGNRNGGLTWIAKGGGYYSECNKRLKG